MPEIVLGLAALLGGIFYLIWRANNAVHTVKELDHNTQGLQRQARHVGVSIFGTRLERVDDPRLAATILMLQLVRTGSHVTAAEKTQIMELMEEPLRIANIETIFTRAWGYTTAKRAFPPVADELVPMLRRRLDPDERLELIAMLTKVANAYGEAGELQSAGIARLKRALVAKEGAQAR